ncbi:MAG: hypothetical protein AABX39_00160 [Nanoarchaeota archaeon]
MNLREYSLSDFAIDKSALKIPACSSCHEICCHSAHNKVSLRIIDIAMLIDIKRTDLINMKHEQEEVIISKRPNFSLMRETIGWKLFPTLKQFLGNNQLCMALTPQLTCGLHPYWPLSCKRYPYSISTETMTIFWAKGCKSFEPVNEIPKQYLSALQAAVDNYNWRIREILLLKFCFKELQQLGITRFIHIEQFKKIFG